MLDIASMTLFLIALDCQYFGLPSAVIGYNQEFPDQCKCGVNLGWRDDTEENAMHVQTTQMFS